MELVLVALIAGLLAVCAWAGVKRPGYRIVALLGVANAPLVAYSYAALTPPAGLSAFRIWAATTAVLSLALHLGASLVVARWLRAGGHGRRAASVREIIVGFRGQAMVALGTAAAMWWLSYRVASELERHAPAPADLAPLSTYGWIAAVVVILLGSLAAVVVAFRQTTLPPARARP